MRALNFIRTLLIFECESKYPKRNITTLTSKRYLTDITSSEGNLKRMSRICKNIADMRVASKRKTARMFEDVGITHTKVIGRYLHILKFLGLIVDRGEFYSLSSEGKVLSIISENYELSTEQKILFFQLFFRKIPDQLYWVLYSIKNNEKWETSKKCFERAVIEYFSLPQIQYIWNKKTLLRSIKEYIESGKLARGIENKFETMYLWLRQMDLVKRVPSLHLTSRGSRVLQELNKIKEWQSLDINRITATYYGQSFHERVSQDEMETITRLVESSMKKFSNEAGLCDLRAVKVYSFLITLSKHKTLLGEKDFHSILEALKERGTIKSFILDRKGKLSFAQLALKA